MNGDVDITENPTNRLIAERESCKNSVTTEVSVALEHGQ